MGRIKTLLDAGDDAAAAAQFFDFRCADVAMGSGHFLVAAVDRIEARLSAFLALNPIPAVTAELDQLRVVALQALGELADGVEIETTSLLRRQVARRCIYGVDLNEIAVELARLAIWIHTFVPGLPLSFLDHNLIAGDSLIGIGSVEEALRTLAGDDEEAPTLYREEITSFLGRASGALTRLAKITDATVEDVKAAESAHREVSHKVTPATTLFDVLISARFGQAQIPVSVDEDTILDTADECGAREVAAEVSAVHFPVVFPEVFLRDRPGFDCILGNPPWDKVRFEPQQFWVTRVPGLNALTEPERKRTIARLRVERPADAAMEERVKSERERFQAYVERSYPHRGRGHYDYAKLFTERAVSLMHGRSSLGYVLPANSLLLGGWSKVRELLLRDAATSVAQARNRAGWLFEDVHNSYAVAFIARTKVAETSGAVRIWPGITSQTILRAARFDNALQLPMNVLEDLSETVVVPWLNTTADRQVFDTMRTRRPLAGGGGWIHGVNDSHWDFSGSGPYRGFSTDRDAQSAWKILMTRHVDAFRINDSIAFQRFVSKPSSLPRDVIARDGRTTLAESHPVIVFRYPSRNDDSRTMIAAALPESGFIYTKGYVHAVRQTTGTTTRAILALLGYLNTFICDWWVRRFVDRHVNSRVINNVRLPDWSQAQIDTAAQLTSALLRDGGQSTLAGGRRLPKPTGMTPLEARVQLEVMAAEGFGLGRKDIGTVLSDFSEGAAACPPALRTAILEALR